jgi:DNA primase
MIGFESRAFDPSGQKIVRKYNLDRGEWNPYLLGSEDVFQALWNGENIWIVEGVFDLVALKRVIPTPTAVGSTMRAGMDNLTLEFIKRYYNGMTSIFVCYDNDETGRSKTAILVNQLKKLGINAYDWKYRGKDPNEIWQQGGDALLRKNFL